MILGTHRLLTRFRTWAAGKNLDRRVHIVGGAVRDLLLGRKVSDVDLAVRGDCRRFCEDFARYCSARMVSLGQTFQSYRVIREGEQLDFASVQGASIHEDLRRRDITFNAMALPLSALDLDDGLLDPCHGRRDVQERTVRMVRAGNLTEDPLRMLRVFRLAAELDFRIHPKTLSSIRVRADRIAAVPGERIFPELKKALSTVVTAPHLKNMASCGLIFELVPELAETVHITQNRYHHLGVWDHTLLALQMLDEILKQPEACFPSHGAAVKAYMARAGRPALLRLGVLLHDIAKPLTRIHHTDGRVTFYGHETEGAVMAEAVTRRMKGSRKEIRLVGKLVRNHLRVQQLTGLSPRRSTLARLVREMDEDIVGLIIVGLADLKAKKGPAKSRGEEAAYLALAARILDIDSRGGLSKETVRPLVTGRDLMETFSLEPSARIGAILEAIRDAFCDGKVTTRAEALEFARLFLEESRNSL